VHDVPETVAGSVVHRDELANVAIELLRALFPMKKAVRLLGVSVSGFTGEETDDPAQKALQL
jgi:DNA polymerase IV